MATQGNRQIYHIEDKERFLDQLVKHNGNITKAARASRISGGRSRVIGWLEEDAWFAGRYSEVVKAIFDDIEEFVTRKAVKNLRAATFMLTSHAEGKLRGYGKRTEITGKGGEPLTWRQIVERAAGENQ